MPRKNSKCTDETRKRAAKFIIESGKSAMSVAEAMDIDKHGLPVSLEWVCK